MRSLDRTKKIPPRAPSKPPPVLSKKTFWTNGSAHESLGRMRVLFVSSEICPLAKTGGLADVSAALPAALARLGVDIRLLMPGYPSALDAAVDKVRLGDLPAEWGMGAGRLIAARTPDTGLPVYLIDCPMLYGRKGGPYQDSDGRDWPDNALRFGLLGRVGALIARGNSLARWRPDLVHANDWQNGTLPALLAAESGPRPRTVFTIHNMAFQGIFPPSVLPWIGLPAATLSVDGAEYYGNVSYLKAGIRFADRITTVSPTYAREILLPEYGCGLHGVLQQRAGDLAGILNGADLHAWNPANDVHLRHRYDVNDVTPKTACKALVQQELGLWLRPEAPLVAFLSRITGQKMADVVTQAVPAIVDHGAQFALIGEGEKSTAEALQAVGAAFPGRVAIRVGYEEALAHRLLAGADIVLAPARFEPCGLTPIYAMLYGAPPVVRRTGGLIDSVTDGNEAGLHAGDATGFVFDAPTLTDMMAGLDRAIALYREPAKWRRIQSNAMRRDGGWDRPARQYHALYCELVRRAPAIPAGIAEARWHAEHKPQVPAPSRSHAPVVAVNS